MPRRRRALGDFTTIRTGCLNVRQVLLLLLLAAAASVYGSVLEFLECSIACSDVKRFIEADARVWSPFLSAQPGFIRKQVLLDPHDAATQHINSDGLVLPSATANCSAAISILWESRALWKSISPQLLSAASARFIADFGYEPAITAHPSGDGYDVTVEYPVAADVAFSRVPPAVIVGAVVGSVAVLAAAVSGAAICALGRCSGLSYHARLSALGSCAEFSHYSQVTAYFKFFRAKSSSVHSSCAYAAVCTRQSSPNLFQPLSCYARCLCNSPFVCRRSRRVSRSLLLARRASAASRCCLRNALQTFRPCRQTRFTRMSHTGTARRMRCALQQGFVMRADVASHLGGRAMVREAAASHCCCWRWSFFRRLCC